MSKGTSNGGSLDDILSAAGLPADDYILLTGVLRPSLLDGCFLLQRYAGSREQFARLAKADVIGEVMALSADRLAVRDLGASIHAVRIRRGAAAVAFVTRRHQVGNEPRTPAILKSYSCCGGGESQPSPAASLDSLLANAGRPDEAGMVIPGVLLRGSDPDHVLVQVDPPGMRDFALIRRADILTPHAIAAMPASAVPACRRGHDIRLVKVREGAVIEAVSGANVRVERQPMADEGCGCGRGGGARPARVFATKTFPGHDPEKGTEHHWWGDVCWEVTRRRPDNGKLDFFCEVEFADCTGWFWNGVCRTQPHWLWGQQCNCAGSF